MLCVEDYLVALRWVQKLGGLEEFINRSKKNLEIVMQWVTKTAWVDMLAKDPNTVSNTSICLQISDAKFIGLQNQISELLLRRLLDSWQLKMLLLILRDIEMPLRVSVYGEEEL